MDSPGAPGFLLTPDSISLGPPDLTRGKFPFKPFLNLGILGARVPPFYLGVPKKPELTPGEIFGLSFFKLSTLGGLGLGIPLIPGPKGRGHFGTCLNFGLLARVDRLFRITHQSQGKPGGPPGKPPYLTRFFLLGAGVGPTFPVCPEPPVRVFYSGGANPIGFSPPNFSSKASPGNPWVLRESPLGNLFPLGGNPGGAQLAPRWESAGQKGENSFGKLLGRDPIPRGKTPNKAPGFLGALVSPNFGGNRG